jgi:RNA polymerase sigma factor (sigma-70 family)
MSDRTPDHLSHITTMWDELRRAHGGANDTGADRARQELMQRYCGAAYRYLLAAVRDPHVADDLTQEFALRFVQGRFAHADPGRGRFRDYVKTALFHLVTDWRRRQSRQPRGVELDATREPAAADVRDEDDAVFAASWRQELLARAWAALQAFEAETGQPYYTVLHFRVANPESDSAGLADGVAKAIGRAITTANARQMLHRAREKFAELLLHETRVSLGTSCDKLQEELAELNLLKYCEAALKKGGC